MLTNPTRTTLALAIASALAAGCQAPSSQVPPAQVAESPAVPVAGAGATPEAPVAEPVAGLSLAGHASVFGKPLANAAIRIFALDGDAVLAEGQTDAQGAFAIPVPHAATAMLRVVAVQDGTTLATAAAVGPVGPSANRVLATIDVVLSEVSTTAYTALYPRLRALRGLTGAESAQVLAAFSSLTRVIASATEAQRQAAIDAVVLRSLDANGLLKNTLEVDRAGLAVLRGIPGFTAAFEAAGKTLGAVIGAATTPPLTFGHPPRSGGGSNSGTPAASTADLTVTVDLPGAALSGLRLLALPNGIATVRVALSGPATAERFREPGAAEDPMTFAFTGLPTGAGYSLICTAESPLGQVLGTTSRVLTLDGDGNIQRDAAGRVLDQASFTLQAGANAVSVRLPLAGPSTQVKL